MCRDRKKQFRVFLLAKPAVGHEIAGMRFYRKLSVEGRIVIVFQRKIKGKERELWKQGMSRASGVRSETIPGSRLTTPVRGWE